MTRLVQVVAIVGVALFLAFEASMWVAWIDLAVGGMHESQAGAWW